MQKSPFLIITDYHGLKVDQFSDLRTRLADAGARYTVVKNTFLNRAAKEAGMPDLVSHLNGQTAIVTGDKDVSAAAKMLRKFVADSKKLTVRAGVVDQSLFTDKQIDALADLPSKEVSQSQLLGLLQAPASRLLRTINEPASMLARLLQAQRRQTGRAGRRSAGRRVARRRGRPCRRVKGVNFKEQFPARARSRGRRMHKQNAVTQPTNWFFVGQTAVCLKCSEASGRDDTANTKKG